MLAVCCVLQVVWDDGSLPDLSALSRVRSIQGPLILFGTPNASLTNLAGLENLQVWRKQQQQQGMNMRMQAVCRHALHACMHTFATHSPLSQSRLS